MAIFNLSATESDMSMMMRYLYEESPLNQTLLMEKYHPNSYVPIHRHNFNLLLSKAVAVYGHERTIIDGKLFTKVLDVWRRILLFVQFLGYIYVLKMFRTGKFVWQHLIKLFIENILKTCYYNICVIWSFYSIGN